MKPIYLIFSLLTFISLSCTSKDDTDLKENHDAQNIYFPPLDSDTWETKSPSELQWNTSALAELSSFLENTNTKSFIILHKGKIAFEQYFNDHALTDPWYWASAGKTLTSTVTGIAQDQGLLEISSKVSDYLGTNWTSETLEQEQLITCQNLLSMDSGLDDSLGDSVAPENLQYIANASNRWAYHNVYVKLQDVVAAVSNQSWSDYFNENLKNKIGMTGTWITIGDLSVYWSTTRSMARFGLMIYANGQWDNQQIVSDAFLNQATNTSQSINEAYGYLWWLNGKSSYHLPQTQVEFTGELIPNGPSGMYCALGKNDQKLYIVPSKDLVIVRMGEAADDSNFALSSYDNALWEKLNNVFN
ncbi:MULTISPECIES: serine hydrolase domain-containing protein [unclassified Olleya]|jgi:CubicO group peptidase (beta-lactamase class C family)|uniref:serine hydrolase domain-containing protein n=1 Tax=unclassified Olleya TaxID=2615019 RepID=UPI00119DC6F8|nr:serine hydrolase [Olleya sp. Hel_I_94]TVZ49728.1 CubicO group peptidase (beta-lactamase class C family) [Olleya sp. Hel_I_94]